MLGRSRLRQEKTLEAETALIPTVRLAEPILAERPPAMATSTSEPMIMQRVGTMEIIAAEEGTLAPEPLSPLSPHAYSAAPGWAAPGWAAPSADTIASLVSTFVQDEAASLRRGYLAARDQLADRSVSTIVASAVEQVDSSLAVMVSSQGRGSLLPTSAADAPPLVRIAPREASFDTPTVAV